MISFRLGGEDGVAVEAAKWAGALGLLGWTVRSVAGAGPVDAVLPGLAMGAPEPPPAPKWTVPSPTPIWSSSRTSARSP